MKRFLPALIFLAFLLPATAQQLRTPSPSSTQTIKQDLGLGTVELSYSRPNVKGRKIFGELVPFGKVWRTGANSATTLTFSDTVTIGSTTVPPGKYGLLTIPDANSWTFIITKQLDVTSPAAYKQSEDVVRVTAVPQPLKDQVETFTIQFADVKSNSTAICLEWVNTTVKLPIKTDLDSRVMSQISTMMNKDNRPYFNAAMYYIDNGKDLKQALDWFNKADEQTPNAYWILHQKANCLAKLGRKEEAKATALKSIQAAKEAKNDDYVALNEKLLATLR